MTSRNFDLVVFGASSFVGKILCQYLYDRYGAAGEVKWAMAGRSANRLKAVQQQLDPVAGQQIPLFIVDGKDEDALHSLSRQTRVLITTVGPYALYGDLVVKACVENGTDYCDLAGEPQWIRRMLDQHEQQARQTGARIVHCCGFDSIPSDMGVWFLQTMATANGNPACQKIGMRVDVLEGEYSGGTMASIVNAAQEVSRKPWLLKQLLNPYALCPPSSQDGPAQNEHLYPQYDAKASAWLAPFIMASINTRVVHRTNALLGYAYGHDFQYDEAVPCGSLAEAATKLAGTGGLFTAAALPVARSLLQRWVLPKPGEGPSPEAQRNGRYVLTFYGQRADGSGLNVQVTGDRDPGYGSTAKILGEAAACLAFDRNKEQLAGGFWTPASALGEPLLQRLTQHAGLTFSVMP